MFPLQFFNALKEIDETQKSKVKFDEESIEYMMEEIKQAEEMAKVKGRKQKNALKKQKMEAEQLSKVNAQVAQEYKNALE